MKSSHYTIGNQTRDLPTCNAVPQPTALKRAHCYEYKGAGIVITDSALE